MWHGRRRLIANFRGSNGAPAWAPDGRTAVTLSRDGGSQLYTIDANGESHVVLCKVLALTRSRCFRAMVARFTS
jgi:Tol biopolymer transport system component